MNVMPTISKDTSEGHVRTTIYDERFENRREVWMTGGIDSENAQQIMMQLLYLNSQDSQSPIRLCINSGGGEVNAGLCLLDVLQAMDCPIYTVCTGMAASMAAVLFSCGTKRFLLPHARVMIHDPLIRENNGGTALRFEEMCKNLMNTRERLAEILAQQTGHTIEEIYEKTKQDTWFTAEEAMDFGIADEVIKKIGGDAL